MCASHRNHSTDFRRQAAKAVTAISAKVRNEHRISHAFWLYAALYAAFRKLFRIHPKAAVFTVQMTDSALL